IVFGLIALGVFVAVVVQQFRALGWVPALAIDLVVVVAVGFAFWFLVFGRHRVAAARLCRRAAQGSDWRYRKPDGALLRRVRLSFPAVRDRVRALYRVVEGTVNGLPLTFVTSRAVP